VFEGVLLNFDENCYVWRNFDFDNAYYRDILIPLGIQPLTGFPTRARALPVLLALFLPVIRQNTLVATY
jgi:hypothetical protein